MPSVADVRAAKRFLLSGAIPLPFRRVRFARPEFLTGEYPILDRSRGPRRRRPELSWLRRRDEYEQTFGGAGLTLVQAARSHPASSTMRPPF